MQMAALTELGLAGEWIYGALDIAPEDFEAEVAALALEGEYAGVNVTVPYKEAALAMADEASEAARAIGAANTLSFRDGRIVADNTDAGGLLRSLPHLPEGERALVLGAGGAARAAIWALVDIGVEVEVWNRTPERAEAVARQLGARAVAEPVAAEYDLIVNTTAVGLAGEDPFEHLPLAADSFRPEQVVVDMVYGEGPSALLAAAAAAGASTVDGLEMLVQQGALSLRIWTGAEPSLEAMRAAVHR
ncbi:MAG: shikimate dehydrogenase [Actinobacteria bacterium]|nr:shikimate dehydrogenase [Actinomycetota bacterium]